MAINFGRLDLSMISSFVTTKELMAIVGKSRATLARWVRMGIFPPPRQLGPNSKAWSRGDVEKWLRSREQVKYAEDAPAVKLTASEQQLLRDRFHMFNSDGYLARPLLDKVFAILRLGPVDETER